MNDNTHRYRYFISQSILVFVLCFYCLVCGAMEVPIEDFSLTEYSQNTYDYLTPDNDNYTKALLSSKYQNEQMKQFYNHYYATDSQGLSPWGRQMVNAVLPLVKKIEIEILEEFNNQGKSGENKHFAENFKEHDQAWWAKIKENMVMERLSWGEFSEENRAIAVTNTYARALPDGAPDFFHASLPGQGFPFDNLQESAIWAGTPLYVLHVSKDNAWSLVLTPDGYFSWVNSRDIAYASQTFVHQWQEAASRDLVAVTRTETSITDEQHQFKFTGYIGSVFPMIQRNDQQTMILIPVKNAHNQAVIMTGLIRSPASSVMPLAASPKHLADIINQLKNRPYGWGGAFFFNDCSQEMKSIFTPFGIWLPRNSAQQARLSSTVDLSQHDIDERIQLLKEKGHPLMTLVYMGAHVMLYVGNKEIDHHGDVAMTYQNIWGMSPENRDKRYIIGQSVFLPLLKSYPENPDIASLASKSNFKLVFLDALTVQTYLPQQFANKFFMHNIKSVYN